MTRTSTITLALLSALCLTGCVSAVRIAEIKTDPGRFDRKTVAVRGTVTSSFGVALVPFQYYNVDDGTGEVTVLSNASRTPTRGARVSVKGKVDDVAVLGGAALGLHLKEEKLSVKR